MPINIRLLQKKIATLIASCLFFLSACAQDTAFYAKHAAILFPYPMYREKWRSAIGISLLTTPQDITEEVRLRIPLLSFQAIRRINDNLQINSQLLFQALQNHLSTGLHVVVPVNKQLYVSAGDDIGFWFGFLKLSGFNSRGSGWLDYPNVSVGFKTNNNLLISFKAEASFNLFYEAANGESKLHSGTAYYNGEAFTLALEQPFYNRRHLALAFSAINNYFYWGTWSLFYRTDRKIFYPQISVALIL